MLVLLFCVFRLGVEEVNMRRNMVDRSVVLRLGGF